MSVVAWVIIGILLLLLVVACVLAYTFLNLGGQLLGGMIEGMGGPRIFGKKKKK